jgi:hypothetical protein
VDGALKGVSFLLCCSHHIYSYVSISRALKCIFECSSFLISVFVVAVVQSCLRCKHFALFFHNFCCLEFLQNDCFVYMASDVSVCIYPLAWHISWSCSLESNVYWCNWKEKERMSATARLKKSFDSCEIFKRFYRLWYSIFVSLK